MTGTRTGAQASRGSAPRISVDTGSGVAPWRQVHDQIEALARTGVLASGAQLPTIRQLARDLGLAAGTVARAYRELEAAGVIRTARRQGTVVAGAARRPEPGPDRDQLGRLAAEFVARARALGVPEDVALAEVSLQYAGGTA